MPEYNNEDLLRLQTPETGRKFKEDATVVNIADTEFARSLLDPTAIVLRKQGFFFQHLRENVPEDNVFHYRITTPADKHVAVFNRDLKAGEGPIRFETIIGATGGGGTEIQPVNLYTGGPASETEFLAGATPVGGVVIPADFLFGSSGFFTSQPTAGSSNLPTILPPNTVAFLRVTNLGTGTNQGIRLALAFAELEIPDILVI